MSTSEEQHRLDVMGKKAGEDRVRRFAHVQRKDSGYTSRRTLKRELPGRRRRR